MRIALLGFDAGVLELARAAAAAGDRVVALFDAQFPADLPGLAADVSPAEDWETLLLGTRADVVIVAAGDFSERRTDQLRKLVQAAVPLVLVTPACEAIVGLELEMIRRDTRSPLVPYLPGGHHPAMAQLADWRKDPDRSPIGAPQQVVLERTLGDLSRPGVLASLTRDVHFFRKLLGPIRKVGAISSGPLDQSLTGLSVHMTTQDGRIARWSAAPETAPDSAATLSVVGERGRARLMLPGDLTAGRWRIVFENQTAPDIDFPPWDEAAAVLSSLRTPPHAPDPASGEGAGDETVWSDACRDREAAETALESIRRNKTIELHLEDVTEEATFKSLMAAGGCLLLFACLVFVTILAFGAGSPAPISGSPLWRIAGTLLFGVLGLFMILQLLLLVFRSPPARK